MRKLATALVIALAFGLAACGSSSSSTSTGQVHFAKTKFVLHAGLAFGAFHRYIYKPWKAGSFHHPFSHKLTLVKAALAGAFVYHELKLARHDAQASKILSRLVLPLGGLAALIHGLNLHHAPSSASINQANSQISQLEHQSSAAGQPINEQAPAHL